jgi:aspartate aminotransferase-like enzyme
MPDKGYLMTPGPTPVPPEVEAAIAKPIVYHRGAEFRALLDRVLPRLRDVFRTANDVAIFTASGTAAMESAVANLCSPGDRVLVVSAGNFGERWAKIAGSFACDVVPLRYRWGETPDPADVGARLAEIGGAKVVYCTHSETSTGVVSDVRGIAAEARAAGALTVVDAISSLGALPLEQDAWGIDVVVSGSQKALMTPPGLAFASVSTDALGASQEATSPRFYLDWARTLEGQAALRPPFTPAVSLVFGLDAALELLLADGLEAAWERARVLGRACREGVKGMGLELFSPDDDRCAVVTAVRVPEGVDGARLVESMRERSGVTAAGGQGELKGKIVRIGHIGYVDLEDVGAALAALGRAAAEHGLDVDVDAGLERARVAHASHASVGAGHASRR